jgi:hypothetical protein
LVATSFTMQVEPFNSMTAFPDYAVTPVTDISLLSLPQAISDRLRYFPAPTP